MLEGDEGPRGGTAELQLGIGCAEGTNDAELELGGPRSGLLLFLVTAAGR